MNLLSIQKNGYGSLISPVRDKDRAVYNWHSFKHSYSKDLVEKLVLKFKLNKNSWVLDPFCGGGITLLACKELGINSEGSDILPFSVFLSNVKTRTYEPNRLKQELKRFKKKCRLTKMDLYLPDIKIINAAFSRDVRKEVLRLRAQINAIRNSKARDFYMLGLLSILESVSNTSKAGGFLRIKRKRVSPEKVHSRFLSRVEMMIKDVETFNKDMKFRDVKADARIADSRKLLTKRKFDGIITSPPYPNRHDYTRIYGLELIVGFIKDHDELKKIRYNTLRSHVEAKKQFEVTNYEKPKIVDTIITKIKKAGLNNSQVPAMLAGYFEDMYLSLLQMKKCLKEKGKLALVVSNVRFGGVNIPVDKILAKIGEQAGLSTKTIITARHRGNSAQQMKKFKRNPSRESIIVWENS